ncbi:hypothetical protein [Microbispora sp. H10949]|uniref:hypothetical protein n=1 Tax=Microbispora sp. H10949 TaxID=2729111 RepID=UPI001601B52D
MDALDVLIQFGIPDRARPCLGGLVGAGRDGKPVLAQYAADRLDTEHLAVFVDGTHECVCGRSSSVAKKAEAAFRISPAARVSTARETMLSYKWAAGREA